MKKEGAASFDSGGEADWIGAALAEYEAHRAEVLAEAQGQQQIPAWARPRSESSSPALSTSGTIVSLQRSPFSVQSRSSACSFFIQWAGRAFGMMRVGVYLEGLENALRIACSAAPPPVLTWEKTLLSTRPSKWWKPHYGWNDFGAVAVFVLLAASSIALGAYRGYAGHEELVAVLAAIEAVVMLLFTVMLAWNLATVRQRARGDFPRPGNRAPAS